ncbi:MAG: 1,4-alpha-glucan branching protein domain-containing protein [Acidobacteriota bacterium]
MEEGYLALILHAHLPFVRHPEYPEYLEEDWLYEAITETYIPLLFVFERLLVDGIRFRITMTITPTLAEMLVDPLLQERYSKHIDKLVRLAENELERTENTPFAETARLHYDHFQAAQQIFEYKYERNILKGFRALQDAGVLEIITCGATHGFLPLMSTREARRAQIEQGCRNYAKHFGRWPQGIWLPECAYEPGIDELLAAVGLKYFIVDSHSLIFGEPRPRYGIFAPVVTPSGVAAFARDVETSEQVWSADTGYPGHPNYREFYRDIGWDANEEYIKPYLHADGMRRNLGIKYFRVTGKVELHEKQPYVPEWATEIAAEQAGHFLFSRQGQLRYLHGLIGRKPMVVSPYDAELFGHWWFEGPQFLNFFIRKAYYDQNEMTLITPSEYLNIYSDNQPQTPAVSSWGAEGYYRVWINSSTDWMYPHQHIAETRMTELAHLFPDAQGLLQRALNQAARELLLAQSSDWAFIITTATMVPYAIKRFKDHIYRFTRLYDEIKANKIDEEWLLDIESKDTIFQEIDYRIYT